MKLTKRGEIVLMVLFISALVALFIGAYWVIDHINWVGDHYCLKSSLECYFPNGVSNITK